MSASMHTIRHRRAGTNLVRQHVHLVEYKDVDAARQVYHLHSAGRVLCGLVNSAKDRAQQRACACDSRGGEDSDRITHTATTARATAATCRFAEDLKRAIAALHGNGPYHTPAPAHALALLPGNEVARRAALREALKHLPRQETKRASVRATRGGTQAL